MELTVSELLELLDCAQSGDCGGSDCFCGGEFDLETADCGCTQRRPTVAHTGPDHYCSVHEIAYPHSKYEKCPLCTEMAYSLCIEPLSGGVPYWQCTCGYKPISFVCPKCGKTQH